jgi:diacylglycerol kinase family enzyme
VIRSHLRYLLAAGWELLQLWKRKNSRRFRNRAPASHIDLYTPDGKVHIYNCKIAVGICNTIRSAAKGMIIAPKAMIDDGLLDVMLVRSGRTLNLRELCKRLHDGSHIDLDCVEYMQVHKMEVVNFMKPKKQGADPVVTREQLGVDGELEGRTPLIAEVIPRVLRFII